MQQNGESLNNDPRATSLSVTAKLAKRSGPLCVLLLSISSILLSQEAKSQEPKSREPRPASSHAEPAISLREGWNLQSSGKVDEKGEILSSPAFQPKDWYTVTVPTTVVAALVEHKVYPDPGFAMNLRSLPGVTYPIGTNFSSIPMQQDSPFIVPWWYRKEFVLPASFKGKSVWLKFGGINYRANIWLNGKQIAKSDEVAGAWRTYEFNITESALPGKANALA